MGTGASQLGSGRGTGEVNFVTRNSLGDVQACDVRPRGRTRPVASSAGSLFESWNLSGARYHALSLVILDVLQVGALFQSAEAAASPRFLGARRCPIGSAAPVYPPSFLSSAALVLGARGCRRFMDVVVGRAGMRPSGSHCTYHHEPIALHRYPGPPCDKSRCRSVLTDCPIRGLLSHPPGQQTCQFTRLKRNVCEKEGKTRGERRK